MFSLSNKESFKDSALALADSEGLSVTITPNVTRLIIEDYKALLITAWGSNGKKLHLHRKKLLQLPKLQY